MITVLAIGIGSGSPAHLTAEAVAALNRVDVFLVADKRADTRDLAALGHAAAAGRGHHP